MDTYSTPKPIWDGQKGCPNRLDSEGGDGSTAAASANTTFITYYLDKRDWREVASVFLFTNYNICNIACVLDYKTLLYKAQWHCYCILL